MLSSLVSITPFIFTPVFIYSLAIYNSFLRASITFYRSCCEFLILILQLFFNFLTRYANFKVDKVSSRLYASYEHVTIN